MKKLLLGMATVGAILYPLVVYFGLTRFQPRYLALFMGVLLLIKIIAGGGIFGPLDKADSQNTSGASPAHYLNLAAGVLIVGLVLYTLVNNQAEGLKLYPVVISFSLLLSFAWS